MAPHELTHFVSLFADRMPPHELTHWSEADRYEQMRLALAAADEEIRTLKISYDIRGSSILKLKANQQRLTSHLANQRECIRQLQETRREKDALIATIQARVAGNLCGDCGAALCLATRAWRARQRGFIAGSVVDAPPL